MTSERPTESVSAPVRAGAAGAFAFLVALGVGAALLVGAKLQVPGLGAGASPVAILKAIVVVSLGALGAPVDLGGVTVQALPLGGLAVVGVGLVSGLRRIPIIREVGIKDVAVAALVLATLCGGAAALSHLSLGQSVVAVPVWAGIAVGAIWGIVFGACGVAATRKPRPSWWPLAVAATRPLAWFGVLCLAVVVLGGVVRVVTQSPSATAATGSIVHGAAFGPNLAIATGALALGAPVEAGFGGLGAGPEAKAPAYSLLDWNGGPTPLYAWALCLIPAAALVAAGRRARRPETIPRDALVFALGCGMLALLGEARVGLDAVERGFAKLAPDAPRTFVFALGWALVGLTLGWLARGRRRRLEESDPETPR